MPGGDIPLKTDEYTNGDLNSALSFDIENDAEAKATDIVPEAEETEVDCENTDTATSKDVLGESADTDTVEESADSSLTLFGDEMTEAGPDEDFDGEDALIKDVPTKKENTEAEAESSDPACEDSEENTEKQTESNSGPEEKQRRVDMLYDFIEIFAFTLIGVFILVSFFFRYSVVDGGSMMNTLMDEEILILRSFLYEPEAGDIVVVQDRSTDLKDPIVKRIIATEGQRVKFTRDAVYVDGVKLDEPYVYTLDYDNPFGDDDVYRYSVYPSDALLSIVTDREDGVFYEITVPENQIFVMGDHRNNSKDSRDVGTLHEDAIIGKVVLRLFPFDKYGKIE